MNLVRLAVQRPVTVLMVLASILLIGTIALRRLPLAFLPEIDVPFIAVEIRQPESSPQQIAKQIAEPVEEALATLPGIKRLRSTSTADDATVVLELHWGQSLDVVRMQRGSRASSSTACCRGWSTSIWYASASASTASTSAR
jgi:hydrophobic/amphiphilic exporter-1 (mainly G- bacteria), HAE1 family